MNNTLKKPLKLNVRFDKKRCGYFIEGHGFDFFLYFTDDYLECDQVEKIGSDKVLHMYIPLNGKPGMSCDVLENKLLEVMLSNWVFP